jgi:predicted Fe-Mo cluster-binding NifX family protein
MKLAVTIWESRISPVADSAQEVLVVEIGGKSILRRHDERFNEDSLLYRARKLADLGVKAFVCGAISDFYGGLVEGYGIRLIPFVHAQVDEVLNAFMDKSLLNPRFVMRGYLRDAMRGAARDRRRVSSRWARIRHGGSEVQGVVPERRL